MLRLWLHLEQEDVELLMQGESIVSKALLQGERLVRLALPKIFSALVKKKNKV
jgi:hypothetical protein